MFVYTKIITGMMKVGKSENILEVETFGRFDGYEEESMTNPQVLVSHKENHVAISKWGRLILRGKTKNFLLDMLIWGAYRLSKWRSQVQCWTGLYDAQNT